ncbi:MAG: gamma-glutamyltransferase [Gammaproteobacteria bacterium]|jgi:gamma-glutamyltranspeptidase/glutathione hydrolase|nr:gamma-glutamyltransferase [Gammaproteobacteria bacterium]
MSKLKIAAGTRIAAEAGASVAEQGGNAVDAAIAAMAVSVCTDTGIMSPGCGAFVTVWPPDAEPVVIDGYAEMPGRGYGEQHFGEATHEVVFDYGGDTRQLVGYGTIATPGGFAGLALASQQFGRLPWNALVEPAIDWVERGFPLTGGAAEYLGFTHDAIYSWHPDSYRVLHHEDGRPLAQGDIVRIPCLADSLRSIASDAGSLYGGELGRRIACGVRENGGLLGIEDLQAYEAVVREPVRAHIGDWEVVTNPPPAVGGSCLAAMLLLLDRLGPANSLQREVENMVTTQRSILGFRASRLDGAHQALPREVERMLELADLGDHSLLSAPSTSHVSVVDADGLACAITASAGYGSGAMVEGTGFWLNNSLGEIDLLTRGVSGLSAGTRLASNMAPTIARRRSDGALLALGSPGASRITTAIAQVLANFAGGEMSLADAVTHPRLHVELAAQPGGTIAFEPGLPVEPMQGLEPRPFDGPSMYFGGVQAVLWSRQDGLAGIADARRGGYVAG